MGVFGGGDQCRIVNVNWIYILTESESEICCVFCGYGSDTLAYVLGFFLTCWCLPVVDFMADITLAKDY